MSDSGDQFAPRRQSGHVSQQTLLLSELVFCLAFCRNVASDTLDFDQPPLLVKNAVLGPKLKMPTTVRHDKR